MFVNFKQITKLNQLQLLQQIGKGGFGEVYLCKLLDCSEILACKVYEKQKSIQQNQSKYINTEFRILKRLQYELFFVQFREALQDNNNIYLIEEYLSNQNLRQILKEQLLTERQIQFLSAEVFLALNFLHVNNIFYRDLKSDHIFLTDEGHIKMIDFGLCAEVAQGKTRSTQCGTVNYLPPEIVLAKPYTQKVDYFSLGCLIYEMFCGKTPFKGKTSSNIYKAILNCDNLNLEFMCSREAEDLIRGLLQKDPERRYGAEQLFQHPFLKNYQLKTETISQIRSPMEEVIQKMASIKKLQKQLIDKSPDSCDSIDLYKACPELQDLQKPPMHPFLLQDDEIKQSKFQENIVQIGQSVTLMKFSEDGTLYATSDRSISSLECKSIQHFENPMLQKDKKVTMKTMVEYGVSSQLPLEVQPNYMNFYSGNGAIVDNGRSVLILNKTEQFYLQSPYNLPLTQTIQYENSFISSSIDGFLLVFDVNGQRQQTVMSHLNYQIGSFIGTFETYGRHLGCAVDDQLLKIIDPQFNFRTVFQQQLPVSQLAISTQLNQIIAASGNQVYLFNLNQQTMAVRVPYQIDQLVINGNTIFTFSSILNMISCIDVRNPIPTHLKLKERANTAMNKCRLNDVRSYSCQYKNGALFSSGNVVHVDENFGITMLGEGQAVATKDGVIAMGRENGVVILQE